jgi:hypothetical protein
MKTLFKLTSKIECNTKEELIKEIKEMADIMEGELNSEICHSCNDCKLPKGVCIFIFGNSENSIESTHKLYRKKILGG